MPRDRQRWHVDGNMSQRTFAFEHATQAFRRESVSFLIEGLMGLEGGITRCRRLGSEWRCRVKED